MPSMLSYPRRLPSGHFTCYLNRTYHVLTTMRRTVVDDVQGSCYYQTVPRVKSGLPVYGSPVWMRNQRVRQAPGKSWLSCEEIRTRVELKPGTPSLKRPAKTFAPGHVE